MSVTELERTGIEASGRRGSASAVDASVPRRRRVRRVVFGTLALLGVILLVAVAVSYAFFRGDLREARRRIASIPTRIYASAYGDIEYRLVGEGPTVLVSHGITGGVDAGQDLVTRWRNIEDDYRFLYVSRFGYLRSSVPDGATPRLQAAAYKALLDHLGIERVFVVGNSAGGTSALWFAIDYPERTDGLILISSAVPGPLPAAVARFVAENDFVYWAAIKFAPDKLIGLLLPDRIRATLTEEERDFIIENAFMAGLPISERTEGIIFDNQESNPGMNDIPFEQVQTPTLIFQSVDDARELRGGHEMAARIPDNQYIGLTGGHFLLRHQDEIRAAIAAFIAEHAD